MLVLSRRARTVYAPGDASGNAAIATIDVSVGGSESGAEFTSVPIEARIAFVAFAAVVVGEER